MNGVPAYLAPGEAAHHRWGHDQLSPDRRAVVAGWPYVRTEEHGFHRISLLHYGLAADGCTFQPILADPSPNDLDRLFAGVPGDLIWYGHHHPRADCTTQRARYVNPGALGCSPDALARYARLTIDDDGHDRIEFRAVPYDPVPLFKAFEERAVPERDFIQQVFFGRSLAG